MYARSPSTRTLPIRDALCELLPSLRARALKLCRDPVEAQDMLHDAIERALRFEQTFEANTNLRAWVHQILFSVFVSHCRRQRRERRALEALGADPCGWTRSDAPPEMITLSYGVERAIATLPRQFAAVVRLVDLDELSYKEAAEQLGVPVGTVMSRLFRGRRLLAAALSSHPAPREAA